MGNRHVWIGTLVILGLLAGPPAAAGLTLARVDDQAITLDDLRGAFKRQHQGHMTILAEEPVVRDFLQSMIRRALFTHEGRRMGIQDLPAIRERVASDRTRIAGDWLYQSEVRDKVRVKDSAIDQAVERMRVTMEVILIQTDSRDEAVRARDRILGGAPAADVAREFSRARSSTRGGLEGLVWGRTEMPAVELAALAAEPGEVTPILPVEEGFCFVKVLTRERHDLPDPDATRRTAQGILERRERAERRKDYLEGLRTRYGASVDESLLDPALLEPLIAAQAAPGDERVLARFEGGAISLADFVTGIDAERYLATRPTRRGLQARQLLDNRLDSALLRAEGDARWSSAPAEVKARLQEIEDDLVFQYVMGSVVFEGLEVTDEEIDAWYADHRDEYVEPPSILLGIALLDTDDDARRFLAEADSTARFAELAGARSRDPETAKRGGVAGWVTPDKAIPELRQAAFDLPEDANGGPVPIEAGFLVYRVLERREAFPTPREEARSRVRSTLIKQKSKERMESWETQLRAAAVIRIHDGQVRKACRVLTREKEAREASRRSAPESPPPGKSR